MGGCNSLCVPTKNPNLCRENHASLPKLRLSKRNYSSTFNAAELMHNPEALNINLATEEELMTLPGINRQTAKNIVEYRSQIGRFKQVEDLAVVSGVGATKLESLRLEICVSKPKSRSNKSNSPLGSVSGIETKPTTATKAQPVKQTNVNTSNVFQLMKVKGIGLIMAQNIVVYRDKKGPFKSLDELLKVKGIGPAILSMMRGELCLDDTYDRQSNSADSGIGPGAQINPVSFNMRSPDSTSTTSDQINQLVAMAGPLTQNSTRPDVIPFEFETDGRRVLRIASWNLQQLTEDKIDNPGVKEVICMTILENGLGLIAFQEVAKKEALQKICEELNNPTLPSISKWKGAKGHWEYHVSPTATGRMFQGVEYNGFLYDTEQEVTLLSSALIENSDSSEKAFVRKPFVGHFNVQSADVAICSVHLKATGLRNEDLDESKQEATTVHKVASAVLKQLKNEKDIIVLGDFNMSPDCEEFDAFRTNGYTNMIPSSLYTNISTKNMAGSQAYDNIWASRQLQRIYSGHHGVIRQGLTSPWIPDGWSWGGVVSDHCPIWVEFYVDKDLDKGVARELEGITLTAAPPAAEAGVTTPEP